VGGRDPSQERGNLGGVLKSPNLGWSTLSSQFNVIRKVPPLTASKSGVAACYRDAWGSQEFVKFRRETSLYRPVCGVL